MRLAIYTHQHGTEVFLTKHEDPKMVAAELEDFWEAKETLEIVELELSVEDASTLLLGSAEILEKEAWKLKNYQHASGMDAIQARAKSWIESFGVCVSKAKEKGA